MPHWGRGFVIANSDYLWGEDRRRPSYGGTVISPNSLTQSP